MKWTVIRCLLCGLRRRRRTLRGSRPRPRERGAGFATAWTTPAPFPTDRRHPQAAAALGPRRTADWLCGALGVDELAVRPTAHGTGIATALLTTVTTTAPDGRAWLLTSLRNPRALAFYAREGRTRTTHPALAGDGIVVLLGPRHPARARAPRGV
ncbi:GNAT family N-acetyltransferase [Streptomyces sp. NPDC086091]|uniref:GNAT family N-acetyltransferase n=1 Tax=Streptomyces sp. NPDC086091 TaxID=3365751 RepID=UPI00380AEE42